MFELIDFPYRPAANEFRRAALVGDVVAFQRTDLASLTSVTLSKQPPGSNVTLTTVGSVTTASTLTTAGVYRFAITADNIQQIASVYVWPRAVLTNRTFTHIRHSLPRKADEIEPLTRRVLHSLVGEIRTTDDSLFAAGGFPSELIGGQAGDGINLRLYGAD
jgi:hypothetical protein